jgi:hypothetical protein
MSIKVEKMQRERILGQLSRTTKIIAADSKHEQYGLHAKKLLNHARKDFLEFTEAHASDKGKTYAKYKAHGVPFVVLHGPDAVVYFRAFDQVKVSAMSLT